MHWITNWATWLTKRKSVNLSWKKRRGAQNYEIYRAKGKSGKYKLVATIAADSPTKWKDASAKSGKRYSYKVRCTALGNGKETHSIYSNVITLQAK